MDAHAHGFTRDQIKALRDERDELRERIRQLEEALAPTVTLPRAWRLSPQQETLLRALRSAGAGILTRERAMLALYGASDDTPDPKGLSVVISHMRRKLAATGIGVEGVYGQGWRLTASSLARFDAAVSDHHAQCDAALRRLARHRPASTQSHHGAQTR